MGERGGWDLERSTSRDSNSGCPKHNGAIYRRAAHTVINQELRKLKSLKQPASADFWVFSTFCCINWKQQVEKTQKYAEAGCLKPGVTKFGPGGPVSLQILAPTLIKHTWSS